MSGSNMLMHSMNYALLSAVFARIVSNITEFFFNTEKLVVLSHTV